MAWTGTVLPLPFTQLTLADHLFQSIYDRRVAHRRYLHPTSAVTAWLPSRLKKNTNVIQWGPRWHSGEGAVLQIRKSLVRSQLVSLELFIDIKSFYSRYGPGDDSACNGNEYQEHFLGIKAAGA